MQLWLPTIALMFSLIVAICLPKMCTLIAVCQGASGSGSTSYVQQNPSLVPVSLQLLSTLLLFAMEQINAVFCSVGGSCGNLDCKTSNKKLKHMTRFAEVERFVL